MKLLKIFSNKKKYKGNEKDQSVFLIIAEIPVASLTELHCI